MSAATRLLALALVATIAACSGGGGATGPDPDPEQPGLPIPPQEPEAPLPPQEPAPPLPPQEPEIPVPPQDPGVPNPVPGIQGAYVLEQINGARLGQLVSLQNPDGVLIGLYRFDESTLTLNQPEGFALRLRYDDLKTPFAIDDAGEFRQDGPGAGNTLALRFESEVFGDSFTGIVVDDVVVISYDFDGDGRLDTTFAFRRG